MFFPNFSKAVLAVALTLSLTMASATVEAGPGHKACMKKELHCTAKGKKLCKAKKGHGAKNHKQCAVKMNNTKLDVYGYNR